MEGYCERFDFWRTNSFFDPETRAELEALDPVRDQKEIEDRFYRDLEFGTGGLRGVMGAGTNRMNRYTVGRAAAGFAQWLLETYGEAAKSRGVAVCADSRNNSDLFVHTTADVLSGMGFRVYLYREPRPTPQLSFTVRYYGCVGGVNVTASHNPKEYNGFKVYDEYGCQLVPGPAEEVIRRVEAITDYSSICFTGVPSLIETVDLTEEFVAAVRAQSRLKDPAAKAGLHIVYTPLHGAGLVPVTRMFSAEGFSHVDLVEAQAVQDGNFPTVVSPNPEDRKALELGIAQARETGADLVLGTDPDSDRVGIAVLHQGEYRLMTGNQVGALLVDYVLRHTKLPPKPALVTTVVTSELGAEIARRGGLTVFRTLTGFKFIGEKMTQFLKASEAGDASRAYDYVFGYEESYGYLAGMHARDKDAVVSALLICEMAAELKAAGKTVCDRMQEIYAEYGFYLDTQDSVTCKGKDGQEQIAGMMARLRRDGSPFADTLEAWDFSVPVVMDRDFGPLPTSNVLKYALKDGSWVAVRPSGTEPKIKIYYCVRSADEAGARDRLDVLRKTIRGAMGLD